METLVRAYFKQRYKGENTVPVVDPDAVDANWQVELNIDIK